MIFTPIVKNSNSISELNSIFNNLSISMRDHSFYVREIGVGIDDYSIISGGSWTLFGYKVNREYEWQILVKYCLEQKDGCAIVMRSKRSTWKSWTNLY